MRIRIALSGKMGVGKSTTAEELKKKLDTQLISIGSAIKPLGNLLISDPSAFQKEILSFLPNSASTQQSISTILTYFDKHFKDAIWEKEANGGYKKNRDYRKLLQHFPQLIRQQFGEDIFLRYVLEKMNLIWNKSYIVDDMRFEGEKQLLEGIGFISVRLDVQPEIQTERLMNLYGYIDEDALRHPTETNLDRSDFHHRIDTSFLSPKEVAEEIIKCVMAL